MAEWSFQGKLISGVILICLLAIVASLGGLATSRILISRLTRAETLAGRELADARIIQLAGLRNLADVRACLASGDRRLAPAAMASGVRVREAIGSLLSHVTDPEGRALVARVAATERAHADAFQAALGARSTRAGGAGAAVNAEVLSKGAGFEDALAALDAHFEMGRLGDLASAQTAVQRSEGWFVFVTLATAVLLVVLCLVLIGALGRSYRRQTTARSEAEHGETEARATLTEVEAASHLKDEFLATVSHELRNPLAPILTWTQLLRSGTLDEEKTRRALEVIERNVVSQAQLIDDLLDVSRVVSGKFRLDVRPIDLAPIIRAAADSQGPASDAKQIRLQLVLDERAGFISGDSERVQQIMGNLISNAIKFTPKGGRVQVVLQRVASHVEIAVSDTGIGIEPAFLPHIFEPFRQATGGSMRRHGGLGLGLSIVRHIVELHGGEIAAESAGPGQGSRFTIKFPLLATTPAINGVALRHPAARDTLSDTRVGRLDGVRVLVVDDEPNASEALVVLFGSCGADARSAMSAPEALTLFEAWRPDILVSDIAMPGEDGYSLIRKVRLRSENQGGGIPAVALTAYAKIEDRVSILGAGFQMYLSKPADPTELVAVVSSLARDHRPGMPIVAR